MGAANPESLSVSPTFRTSAAAGALAVEVNFATDFGGPCRRIRVGVAGDLDVTDSTGNRAVIHAVQIGEPIDLMVSKIHVAGTTAQQITAFA
jgi:hypothetical protein